MTTKTIATNWFPEKHLLVTQISGEMEKSDIEQWEKSLHDTLQQLEDNTTFKIFINLYGFKATDIDAHKRFRDIVPLTLADYGWKVGYVNLFEEESKTLTIQTKRGIRCIAAAHSHQDETKMEMYETRFGSTHEHFFNDPLQAEKWIEEVFPGN